MDGPQETGEGSFQIPKPESPTNPSRQSDIPVGVAGLSNAPNNPPSGEAIPRREALKIMAAAGTAVAVAGVGEAQKHHPLAKFANFVKDLFQAPVGHTIELNNSPTPQQIEARQLWNQYVGSADKTKFSRTVYHQVIPKEGSFITLRSTPHARHPREDPSGNDNNTLGYISRNHPNFKPIEDAIEFTGANEDRDGAWLTTLIRQQDKDGKTQEGMVFIANKEVELLTK